MRSAGGQGHNTADRESLEISFSEERDDEASVRFVSARFNSASSSFDQRGEHATNEKDSGNKESWCFDSVRIGH